MEFKLILVVCAIIVAGLAALCMFIRGCIRGFGEGIDAYELGLQAEPCEPVAPPDKNEEPEEDLELEISKIWERTQRRDLLPLDDEDYEDCFMARLEGQERDLPPTITPEWGDRNRPFVFSGRNQDCEYYKILFVAPDTNENLLHSVPERDAFIAPIARGVHPYVDIYTCTVDVENKDVGRQIYLIHTDKVKCKLYDAKNLLGRLRRQTNPMQA